MRSRRRTMVLSCALVASASTLPARAAVPLAPPWTAPDGSFRIRPLEGLRPVPDDTPEVEAMFLGTVGDHGPVSLNVLYFPGAPEPGALEERALAAVQREVAESMERAQPLGVRALPPGHSSAPGFDMEFLVFQAEGEAERPMFMVQRQLHTRDGVYNLTAYCLEASRVALRDALARSLDSFVLVDELSEASAQDLLLDATFRFSLGQLEDAVRLAARVGEDAGFGQRVAALRIRLAGLVAMGLEAEALELVGPLTELWARDDRPFSAHYAWMLRRGRPQLRGDLRKAAEASGGDPGARAALATVALTRWAGPPDQVPPRLSETQLEFYAALREADFRHPRDDAANWRRIWPTLTRCAAELEDYMTRYEAQAELGAVEVGYGDEGFQWITSSLPLGLAAAIHEGDAERYDRLLDRYARLHGRIAGASRVLDPTAALRASRRELLGLGEEPFRELDFRIQSLSGGALLERARARLVQGGWEALEEALDPLRGP